MSSILADAAIQLCKREAPALVAASGLVFQRLEQIAPLSSVNDALESCRGGVWGETTAVGVGYPILRSTNMRGTRVDVKEPAWADISSDDAERCALQTGDILITKASGSSDLVGKAALFVAPNDNNRYLFSNFTLRLRPDAAKILPEFLAWFLRSPQSLLWRFDTQQNAVGLRNLQTKSFLSQQIPLPDFETQQQIVAYLNAIEQHKKDVNLPPSLAEQQRIVAHIEALAEKIERARGLRRLAVAEAKYLHNGAAQYLLSNLPKALFRPLRDVVMIKGGGTPSKANPEYWNGNIPWVSPKDMKRREIFDAEDHISEDAALFSSARIIEPGAVLIVVRGMIMAHTIPSAILRVPAAINQDMKALIPSACLASDYLCAALWAYNSHLLALIESSTHGTRKFETPKLLDFEIPVPSLSEQARIVAHLDGLQAQVHAVQRLQTQTSAELGALLPSVLDKAFRT